MSELCPFLQNLGRYAPGGLPSPTHPCNSLQYRHILFQEPGEVDLMHEVHEEGRKGAGLGVPDRQVHFGLAV